MLYVTHDQIEAMTLGDRIVVMHQGRVRQVDTPARVYDRPADTFVAGFLGSPPMNLLAGTLDRANGHVVVRLDEAPHVILSAPTTIALGRLPKSGAVTLGVRPEHLRASPPPTTPDADSFDATVELAEALGHEQLLHLRVGSVAITVRGAPGERPTIGSAMRVHADRSRMHLFERDSGVSLRGAD